MFDENTLQLLLSAVLVAAGFFLRSAWDWFQRRRTWLDEARGKAYLEFVEAVAHHAQTREKLGIASSLAKIGLVGSPSVLNAMEAFNRSSKKLDNDENFDLFAKIVAAMRGDLLSDSVDSDLLTRVLFERKSVVRR